MPHQTLTFKPIVKSIHPNTLNNISTNKKQNLFNVSLKSQSLFSSCVSNQSSPDLRLSPHNLTEPLFAAALPHQTSVHWHTILPDLGDLFLFSILMGFAIFWLIWPLLYFDIFTVWVCCYFGNKDRYGFHHSKDDFFFFFFFAVLVHAILVFQKHYLSSSILFIRWCIYGNSNW